MLRFKARITVYRKNEENNHRDMDFPFTEQQAQGLAEEIRMLIEGVHLVDDEGNVYVLSVANIGEQ